jgi:hypothetical protein
MVHSADSPFQDAPNGGPSDAPSAPAAASWHLWSCAALVGVVWLAAVGSLWLPWFRWILTNRDTGEHLGSFTLWPLERPEFVILLCVPLAALLWALIPVLRRPPRPPSLGWILVASSLGLLCLLVISAWFFYSAFIVAVFPGMGAGGRIPKELTTIGSVGFWLCLGAYLSAPLIWVLLRPGRSRRARVHQRTR